MSRSMDDPALDRQLTIEPRLGLYLLRVGRQTEAISFGELLATTNALAGRLGKPTLAIAQREVGTSAAFDRYQSALRLAAQAGQTGGLWFHPATPEPLRNALSSARSCGRKVRLYYGDPDTGQCSLATTNNVGWIGRMSGAVLAYPMLLSSLDAKAGLRILDSGVVRVQDLDSAGMVIYEHPHYHLPEMSVSEMPDSTVVVLLGDAQRMQFTSNEHFARWKKYMRGSHHNHPKAPAAV